MEKKPSKRAESAKLSAAEIQRLLQNTGVYVSDAIGAQLIGIPVSSLRRWRHEGRGPKYSKIGASVRYKVEWLLQYLEQNIVETSDTLREAS